MRVSRLRFKSRQVKVIIRERSDRTLCLRTCKQKKRKSSFVVLKLSMDIITHIMYIEIPNVCPCPSTSYVPYISSVKTGRAKYLLGFTKAEDKCNIIEEGLCII